MSETDRTLGLVKWFNSKYGYGFITALEGDKKDIFVHYSALTVVDSQYKYLVQGEYVEFELVKSTNENHEFQAINISGVKGGPIMCETRNLNKQEANPDDNNEMNQPVQRSRPPAGKPTRRRPVEEDGDKGFVTVERKQRKPTQKKLPVA